MNFRLPFALAAFLLSAAAQAQANEAFWIQLTSAGVEVRAATAGACPTVAFDAAGAGRIPMLERSAPGPDFPRVCSLAVPANTKIAHIAMPGSSSVAMPVDMAQPRRILVLGDTGCRIKGSFVQACNDPIAWPFARLALAAAALKPDLVIHLGDYLYRESPCPQGNAGCAGSPFGDNWDSWAADFFAPAAPLLAAAPWIFIRGNHEDCSRGGAGYLRLLGPIAYDPLAPCIDHLAPYGVDMGGQTIAVMDNASASDTSVDPASVAVYRGDFEALKAMADSGSGRELWLAAHRPIWAAISGPLGIPIGGNATLIAASGDLSTFAAISLMLSGHVHTFEAINYVAKVPPQIVAGHGGDKL